MIQGIDFAEILANPRVNDNTRRQILAFLSSCQEIERNRASSAQNPVGQVAPDVQKEDKREKSPIKPK